MNLGEIAKKRNLTVSTIIEHLSKCEQRGRAIDWDRFIDNKAKEKAILEAIEETSFERLKPIKEILGEDISYEDIKIVIAKHGLK